MAESSMRSVQVLPEKARRQIAEVDKILEEHDSLAPGLPVLLDWGPPAAPWRSAMADPATAWRVHLRAHDNDFVNRANHTMRTPAELRYYLMAMRHAANGWQGGVVCSTEAEGRAWVAGKQFILEQAA